MSKLIRLTTDDGLELHGLFFEPNRKAKKVLIHVHGLIGNFYESMFIDHMAEEATSRGFAFLTFNNRGAGIVNDFIRRKKLKVDYVRAGGSLEDFKKCVLDVKAAVDFSDRQGYKTIILQGHSLGCQKITYYKYKTGDKRVKGLSLLAPVDDVAFVKGRLGRKHSASLDIAKRLVKEDKGNDPVPKWMAFYPLLSARVFLNIADPKSASGRIFDFAGDLKEIKSINCPKLAVFGDEDEYQSAPNEKLRIVRENTEDCTVKLIKSSGHGFVGFEEELAKLVGKWL